MSVGLYFGSFNPVHNGHLMIANYILEYSDLRQIWFVVSPQNPFKEQKNLLADYHRLELLRRAIGDSEKYKISDIEFRMPKPSYTVDTLAYLKEKYPDKKFSLIIGSDNLKNFGKWKNAEMILKNHDILVYPRPGFDEKTILSERTKIVNAPLIEVSSTFIRQSRKSGKDVRFFMPTEAYRYLEEMHFYEK
jgi:nicotinate-nucleotide adenylyltransferase